LTACINWTGRLDRDGYSRDGSRLAYRLIYEGHHGPIPAGMHIDHLCRNRACVNVEHLEVVTPAENARRAGPFRTFRPPVAVLNAAKTHCVNGHEFSEENTYVRPCGSRDCRACVRERVRQYKRRRTAA
jgi:hypothetical protein